MRRRAGFAAIALAVAATGCLVGPNFRAPGPPTAATWDRPDADAGVSPSDAVTERDVPAEWWALFRDEKLNDVLRTAIAANHTLAAARATLAEAREGVIEARSGLDPRLDLGAGYRREKDGETPSFGLYSFGPSLSYAIDAFGGTRRQVEQARALAEAQKDQLLAAYLTLTGDAVSEAVTIASTRLQISTVEDLIRNDQRNLDMTSGAFKAGRVARTDVLTAQAQLESDRTQLPTLQQSLAAARHALAILAGKAPGEWSAPDFEVPELEIPAELPSSLPSSLVRQRPDILAAEAELHADSAAIGVATAQMYPQIVLTASFTGEAAALADLLKKAARVAVASLSGDETLFRGGALAAQRRAAIDAYAAQLENYRETVLQAFAQVADALSALANDAVLVASTRRALDVAASSLELQRSSYTSGKTSALQLISAENTYSQARLGNARAEGQRLEDTAQLFVVLGGGWWNRTDLAGLKP